VGSILGRYIEQAQRDGRIRAGPLYDPLGADVHLVSDIGYRDAAAWWWVQPCPGGFRVLDHDEDNGLDAEEWIERLRAHPFPVGTLWLPHDARAKTFRSRLTVVDIFTHSGLAENYRVVPQTSIADRINAGRMFMRRCEFDRAACARGLISLREWKFQYDEERHAYSASPQHDEHSHTGDALTYCGVALREEVREETVTAPSELLVPAHYAFSLEQLYEGLGHGGRIDWA
jgi:phage terminase large subunit